RLAAERVFAQHDVALEPLARTSTLRESAIADPIGPRLDEVADQIAADRPMACSDDVDGDDRAFGLTRACISDRVVFDQSVVGEAAVLAVHLEVGIEVDELVVARDEMRRGADYVERVFAMSIHFASTLDDEVPECP